MGPWRSDQIFNDLTQVESQKGFKLVHLNIRSLINKYDQLKMELNKSTVDIFSISETWLTAGVDSKKMQIPDKT